jgi:phosphoserine aminotransferase
MISFYPGPSRIHNEIPKYVHDAAKLGIMSINHRSEEFVAMSKKTIGLLKQKLGVPKDYTILYTSSATECWEIIAQSLNTKKSYHIYNGAFGEKWFEYTSRIHPQAVALPFHREERLNPKNIRFDNGSVICITHNETSNGTQVSNNIIRTIKKNNPNNLIAVDATSSMAGVRLEFKSADIWFASVQKCFGLPAGLALMICSPQAVENARARNERAHYNSLPFMFDMMVKWQTPFTPNVLSIYLLMRVMEKARPIAAVDAEIRERFETWQSFFSTLPSLRLLIHNKRVRSLTVIPVEATTEKLIEVKAKAKKNSILVGEGYGDLKASTFRIANFPAISKTEIQLLKKLLKTL